MTTYHGSYTFKKYIYIYSQATFIDLGRYQSNEYRLKLYSVLRNRYILIFIGLIITIEQNIKVQRKSKMRSRLILIEIHARNK